MADYEDIDYNKPMSFKVWKKIIPFILPQKKTLIKCTLLMFSVALVDVFLPILLGYTIKNNIVPRSAEGIGLILTVIFVLVIVQGINVRYFVDLGIRAETGVSRAIRNAVFLRLQKLGIFYYNKTPVGYMMARTNSDTSRIGDLVAWGVIDFSWSVFYCIGAIIAMFFVHWRLAFIVCATILPLALLTWFFQKRILFVNRILRKINSKMTGAMNEGITGARTVKTLVAEKQCSEEYSEITAEYRSYAKKMAKLKSVFIPTVMFVGTAATALTIGSSSMVDLAILAIFLQYAASFFEPVHNIANILTEFAATQANVERVSGLLQQEPGITEKNEVLEKYGDTFSPKKENWEPLLGDIEFKGVTFKYPDGKENVLENFNLHVERGTYAAIVGETGAGKSTLVNLVCRFFEPDAGEILIDGRDYRERSQLWLHSNLGYVLQNPHLFSGSIRENIRYGRLDASDEEVENAAKIVHADKVIAKLKNGYDTESGEGGDLLSTGEKQLISFARAILANPQIFILDEATSSVDTETEMLLQKAISRLLEGRTSFVIAHRLSTIRNADIILVVHDGKIIERGTHTELMKKSGVYFDLYTRQFEEEAEEKVLGEKPKA